MKTFYSLSQALSEAAVKWVRPFLSKLTQEYNIEYKKHPLDTNPFPTIKDFIKAVAVAKTMTVTAEIDKQILNRSRTKTMRQLLTLIKTYRSYPQYRNEKTLIELKKTITGGGVVDMPIVYRLENGDFRIMSGNTRMDIAFMHGINPTVIILDLRKPIKSNMARPSNSSRNPWPRYITFNKNS